MQTLIIFLIIGFFTCIQAQNQEPLGLPISPEELLEIQQTIRIVDFRGDKAQDLDGFIEGSILVPNPITVEIEQKLFNLENDTVVYVVDGGQKEAKEAENILKKYGIVKFRCYLSGIKNWTQVGGKVGFPRFIKFQALQESLQRKSILLIDVRNRTELNEVGQIPGSVCLPLHEVNLGTVFENQLKMSHFQTKIILNILARKFKTVKLVTSFFSIYLCYVNSNGIICSIFQTPWHFKALI